MLSQSEENKETENWRELIDKWAAQWAMNVGTSVKWVAYSQDDVREYASRSERLQREFKGKDVIIDCPSLQTYVDQDRLASNAQEESRSTFGTTSTKEVDSDQKVSVSCRDKELTCEIKISLERAFTGAMVDACINITEAANSKVEFQAPLDKPENDIKVAYKVEVKSGEIVCPPRSCIRTVLVTYQGEVSIPINMNLQMAGSIAVCFSDKVFYNNSSKKHRKWIIPISDIFSALKDNQTEDPTLSKRLEFYRVENGRVIFSPLTGTFHANLKFAKFVTEPVEEEVPALDSSKEAEN